MERCQPIYEEMPGWQAKTSHLRKYKDLPLNARKYVERLSKLTGCQVSLICVGPGREQTIEVKAIS